MLTINIDYFQSKPVQLPSTTIMLDNGYHPSKLESELKKVYPEIRRKIQFELSRKLSQLEKEKKAGQGLYLSKPDA